MKIKPRSKSAAVGRNMTRLAALHMVAHSGSRCRKAQRSAAKPPPASPFGRMPRVSTSEFVRWCEDHGITLHPDVCISNQACGGRGLIALRTLLPGTILFHVPKEAMLSVDKLELAAAVQHLEGSDQLILAIAYETQLGAGSRWCPYLRYLPSCPPAPLFWDKRSNAQLRGTEADETGGIAELRLNFERHIAPVAKIVLPRRFLFREYCRIGSIVRAYGFWDGFGSQLRMIPMADMLNHHCTNPNAALCDDDEPWAMRSTHKVQCGHELFNTYGQMGNAQLLSRYGFTIAGNPLDHIRLPLQQMLIARRASVARQLLTRAEREDWPSLVLDRTSKGQLPAALRVCAVVASVDEADVERIKAEARVSLASARRLVLARTMSAAAINKLMLLVETRKQGYQQSCSMQDLKSQIFKLSNQGSELSIGAMRTLECLRVLVAELDLLASLETSIHKFETSQTS